MSGRSNRCLILALAVAGCARSRPSAADRAPAVASQDWWSAVKRGVAEDQRRAQRLPDGRFSLVTPDLRMVLDPSGVRVVGDRVDWSFDLESIRRSDGTTTRAGSASLREHGTRVELVRPGVTEWYLLAGTAIEQGFDLAEFPGVGDLVVEGRVTSVAPPAEIRAGIRYGALTLTDARAYDAAGRPIDVRMEANGTQLSMRIPADALAGALWPVTIDPVLRMSPVWEYSPLAANLAGDAQALGESVAGVGDVNCDGLADVVVGVPGFEVNVGSPDIGRVYVFFGAPSGLSTTPGWQISAPPGGLLAGARFGSSVSAAGDVDGDDCADFVVGAPGLTSIGQAESGRAYVFSGGAGGPGGPTEILGQAQIASHFGATVAGVGDVDDDGYSDVAVGAPDHDGVLLDDGRAYLFRGGASGVAPTFSWSTTGTSASARYGTAIAAAGDVDGNGAADLVIGAPDENGGDGRAYVFLGIPGADPSTTPDFVLPDASEVQAGARFGAALGSGDTDGDGFSDIAVGAPDFDDGTTDEGRVFLYRGGATGLVAPAAWAQNPAPTANARFGAALGGAGDLDADGLADFIVGSPTAAGSGQATVLLGDPGAMLTAEVVPLPAQSDAAIGAAVAAGGDVNGDGFGEVVIGAARWDEVGLDGGRAFAFYGSPLGLGVSGASADTTFNPEPETGAYFGWSVQSAGDVNADGYGDVVVGAPLYDFTLNDTGRAYVFLGGPNGLDTVPVWAQTPEPEAGGLFGWSVAGAGDLDDDGYGDLLVSARDRDAGGRTDAGKVYAFHGGPAGPSLTPDWQQDAPDPVDNGHFGAAVARAGHVNADSYGDVIIGAPSPATIDPGRAYVFYGASLGLSAGTRLDSPEPQADAQFGAAVAGAGDLDADGLNDVVVGAPGFDAVAGENEHGRAYVFSGTPGGIEGVPRRVFGQGQPGARMGSAVAGGGDVDGDGYSDVLLGAPLYDATVVDAGRAILFRGGPLGAAETPIWNVTADPSLGQHFGTAVAGSGDVNGDGFSDVAVGTESDRAYVFFGGASGPSTLNDWSASGLAITNFGRSLAISDVTGDGFGDLAVGAANEATGGLLHVFFGGDDLGGRPRLEQLDTGDNPIRVGANSPDSTVTLQGVWSNPAWQGARVALEVEVRIVGVPFQGVATAMGPFDVAGVATRVQLGPLLPGSYRWRARAVWPGALGAARGTLGHGRWIDFGDNDPAEADFRVDWPLSLDNSGDPCGVNSECFSRFCRDGVCCPTRCEAACQSCETGTCEGVDFSVDPDPLCAGNPCFTGQCARGECAVRIGAACGPCLTCDTLGQCVVPASTGGCGPDLGTPEADMGTLDLGPDVADTDASDPPPDAGADLSDTSESKSADPFACDCSIGAPATTPVAWLMAVAFFLLRRRRSAAGAGARRTSCRR